MELFLASLNNATVSSYRTYLSSSKLSTCDLTLVVLFLFTNQSIVAYSVPNLLTRPSLEASNPLILFM